MIIEESHQRLDIANPIIEEAESCDKNKDANMDSDQKSARNNVPGPLNTPADMSVY